MTAAERVDQIASPRVLAMPTSDTGDDSADQSARTATSAPAGDAVAVGHDGQRVGERRRRQLVAALGADRAHVAAAVVPERRR